MLNPSQPVRVQNFSMEKQKFVPALGYDFPAVGTFSYFTAIKR